MSPPVSATMTSAMCRSTPGIVVGGSTARGKAGSDGRNVTRRGDCPASWGPVIIWINGAFGAGKTMLAEELHQPGGTLMLRSDKLTLAELADEVMARAQG